MIISILAGTTFFIIHYIIMFENKFFSYIIYMTVEYNDISTIRGIKKKLEYKVEKAIKDSIKEAKKLRIKRVKINFSSK